MKYVIDAKEKKLGRVASEAATLLMGKNKADFTNNNVADVSVHITNVGQLKMDPKKQKAETYERFTQYPGGFKLESMNHIIARKGIGEIMRRAVYGMLPINKLRAKIMKNLTITE